MKKNIFIALLAAAFAITGCGDDKKEDGGKEDGGGKEAKCSERSIAYSCDIEMASMCIGVSKGTASEDELKEDCALGEFAAAPCSTTDLIGSCELGCVEGNRVVMYFYEGILTEEMAKESCEGENAGTWKSAK